MKPTNVPEGRDNACWELLREVWSVRGKKIWSQFANVLIAEKNTRFS